ncbi:MAG: extracellular solute-binding protein [Candidatus Eisenbacteria bacterium]|nr:extracellular solute-binding protein [Candidatus Eisenbacteria bacterium]
MKKLLFLLFLSLLLVSCARKRAGEEAIVIWEQMDPAERTILDEVLREYEAKNPTIKLSHLNYNTEEVRNQFQTHALAGGGPQLVYGPSDQVGPFSALGIIKPLEEIFGSEFFSKFVPASLDTLNGHIYAVPDQVGNHLFLIYNKKLVKKPPHTSDELISIAKKLTIDRNSDGTPDQYGLAFDSTEPFWLVPFLGGFGGWIMDRQENPTLDTPAMVNALAFMKDLRMKYKVLPRECNYQLMDTLFKEGKAAMIINGPWSLGGYMSAGMEIGVAKIPKISETGLWPAPMISARGYSINENVKGNTLKQVKKLVEYLTSPEVELRFAKGLSILPSRKEAYDDPFVKESELLRNSGEQVQVGHRMPVIPEMRAIWDSMGPFTQKTMSGAVTPEQAAKKMQALAIQKIKEMKD